MDALAAWRVAYWPTKPHIAPLLVQADRVHTLAEGAEVIPLAPDGPMPDAR